MKIVVGCFYHETNTFNPFSTRVNDFVYLEGEAVLERLGASEVFEKRGATLIPSVYATALSSGEVTNETYRFFADKILEKLKEESDVVGVWLHLHGSMVVEGLGSGELALMKEIREIVGDEVQISLTLDIHANIALDFHEYVNIVRSYRTVPHEDQHETEAITANLLMNSLEKKENIEPSFIRLPMMICGEKALGDKEPLRSIFDKLEEVETREGIATASYFICHAWSDTENTTSSIFVTPESKKHQYLAKEVAKELAEYVFNKRYEFEFDAIALEPEKAIQEALQSKEKPVFISDSGDNTTAGATGMNTSLLKLIKNTDTQGKKILVAAIFDEVALETLNAYELGMGVTVKLGKNIDEDSQSITLEGTLKAKGDLLGYLNASTDKTGNVCTVSNGDLDVVVADNGSSFITIDHFITAGLHLDDYDIIVVKQGYLFPELSKKSKKDILALTAGTTYQLIEEINYQNRQNPLFPMEDETKLLL